MSQLAQPAAELALPDRWAAAEPALPTACTNQLETLHWLQLQGTAGCTLHALCAYQGAVRIAQEVLVQLDHGWVLVGTTNLGPLIGAASGRVDGRVGLAPGWGWWAGLRLCPICCRAPAQATDMWPWPGMKSAVAVCCPPVQGSSPLLHNVRVLQGWAPKWVHAPA